LLDLVALKYAIIINGVTEIALTKSDVLDTFNEIKVCTEYELDNKIINTFPSNPFVLQNVKPRYQSFKGWNKSFNESSKYEDLPSEFKEYVEFIENYVGVKVRYISTGPARKDIIIK
jgi:adenylosuccinate synthase